jgi:hypothetical protein
MFYTIYKITNKINDKFYLGKHQTKDLDDGYMGSGKLIRAAIKKYGIENFTKEIIHVFASETDMNEKEKELVVLSEMSYNLCEGGRGGFSHINKNRLNIYPGHAENARLAAEKNSKIFHEKIRNDAEFRAKFSETMKKASARLFASGYIKTSTPHSEETKRKIGLATSKSQKGPKNSQYGTIWVTNGIVEKKVRGGVPDGYTLGRLQSAILAERECVKKKEKEESIRIKEETIRSQLRPLYEIYKVNGFEGVKQVGYKYSKPNLVTSFAKYLPEFVPQNGKRRKV